MSKLALLHPTPTARLLLLMSPLQMQLLLLLRLRPKRPRLDLCAMHGIKTLPCKNLPECECKMQQYGSPQRNNLNIVCDVAYDVAYYVIVTTYDVQSRTYDVAYDEDHTQSYFGPTTS
jgi:hypothetical protein